jgi:hypothetical protein
MSGGGVALGPKPRSYRQHTPKKMVRLALLSALSDRAIIGRVCVIDQWGIEEAKTRDAATILRKLRLAGRVLIVLSPDEVAVSRSFANLQAAQITSYAELSAHDVLRADWILFSDATLPTSPDDFSGTHGTKGDGSDQVAPVVTATTTAPATPKAQAKPKAQPEVVAEPEAVEAVTESEEADADA